MNNSQEASLSLADLLSTITLLGFRADQEALHKQLLVEVCRLFTVETAALYLLDESNDEWLIRKGYLGESWNDSEQQKDKLLEWSHQVESRQGNGLVRECLKTASPVLASRIQENQEFDPSRDAPSDMQVHSMLCVPLISEGNLLGALQLINKNDQQFDLFDQELLQKIGSQAASALIGAKQLHNLRVANFEMDASRRELLKSRDNFRRMFDHLPMGIYIVDKEYQLLAVNQARSRQVNQSPPSLENQVCYQVLFNRFEPCPDCRIKETFVGGASTQRTEQRDLPEVNMEVERRGEEGVEWEINTYPIYDEQGGVVFSIVLEQDVTEKYLLENILARSEKLAVIGQLAAGVAHEINNPLTAIIANAQILHRDLPADHDLQDSVDLISRAGARAAQVVRNLLDFARKEEFHLGLTDVNETVGRALELIRHEIMSRSIRLKFKSDPSLPSILASEDQLQSVWLNLLLNAIDALDKEPASVSVQTRKVGSEILISIADNGKGIPPERLTRIFEPFFTTKAPGRGTGLGLSVSHRIVKQHGGTIRVESKVGSGSEFTVILPAS